MMRHGGERGIWSVCALAILLLDETLARGAEHFDAIALACVGAAIIVLALPLCFPRFQISRIVGDVSITLGICLGLLRLPAISLCLALQTVPPVLLPVFVLALAAAVLSLLLVIPWQQAYRPMVFGLFLLDFALLGWFQIGAAQVPRVDVFEIQQLGCDALVHGIDPYTITFPDIYGPQAHYYPTGTVVNGRVQCGYFYPPPSLLMALPGYELGDVRLAHLAALIGAAGLIGFTSGRYSVVSWLLLTPHLLFILENAWIESFLVLLLAATVVSAHYRQMMLAGLFFGVLLVSKQYLLLTAPAVFLLAPRPLRGASAVAFFTAAVAAAVAVTLPFVIWSPAAFFYSNTVLYTHLLRNDSIGFLPLLSKLVGGPLTLMWAAIAAGCAAGMALATLRPSPGNFAYAIAFIGLCCFAFSTQAFVNYYFFSIGAVCLSMVLHRKFPAGRRDKS
jgi:hypothetical protein